MGIELALELLNLRERNVLCQLPVLVDLIFQTLQHLVEIVADCLELGAAVDIEAYVKVAVRDCFESVLYFPDIRGELLGAVGGAS